MVKTTSCKRCNAPIVWLKTRNDRWMPCDEGDPKEIFDPTKHKPHWATCPDAQSFRKTDSGGKQKVTAEHNRVHTKEREEPRSPARAIFIAHDRMSNEAIYRGPNGEQIRLNDGHMLALKEIPRVIAFDPKTLKPILP